LIAKLHAHADQYEDDLIDFIDEKRGKMSEWIEKFSHENVNEEYRKKWKNKKRNDGQYCTEDDVYKHFERTIIGIQDDIDFAVLALHFIERDQWVIDLFNEKTMYYVENEKIHGRAVKSYHPHPEITLVSCIDKNYKYFKGKLPVLNDNEQNVPYLYVASGIKSCQKCHTLLSGNRESNFDGFNGTYRTRNTSDFVVFVYDHYNSGYPAYWIPTSFESILQKTTTHLQKILDEASIPSRQRERDDRIEFFLDRIIQENQVLDFLEETDELEIIETPQNEKSLLTPVPVLETVCSHSPAAQPQDFKPAVKGLQESSISFWSKLSIAKSVPTSTIILEPSAPPISGPVQK
jgi:hypothetical protein